MTLLRLGLITLNVDRVVAIVEAPGSGFRLLFDDGREIAVLDPADAGALELWLEGAAQHLG
jgi:hypothetical protein